MANTDMTATQFLEKIKPYVIDDMKQSGILASLTAAQAFIESGRGNSKLTKEANNLFGMKGKYNGQSVTMLTTEYYNGVPRKVYAAFRKYPSWLQSVQDHSALFNRLERYRNLRGCKDYVQACVNVQNDGYATSPTYANTLIKTINKYKLYEWDAEVLGTVPEKDTAEVYPTLKFGDRNAYVLSWQKFLNLNSYYCGLEDGIFGKNTERAVKEWQEAHGLIPDGVIGKKTWASINLSKGAQ